MLAIIIACEVGFWVVILGGLVARYPLKRRRLGLVLLALTPVLDLILLAANAIDLSRGSTATFAHGLAAIYLGVSVAYGHKMIQWADTRFAHRFADGPAPTKRYESAYTAECWRDVVRTGIALAIAASVLWLLIAIASDPQRSAALTSMFGILGIIAAVELVRAIGYTLWPKKTPVVA
ncbi:hypothetical protein ASF06_13440 [Agreia sp. Leaf244]|nr:hypothetical protein ASF06_13440 [Agreia sp. Leaf244]